jgi:(E)-4-hydroxy-3-methylbut-2-enyl-diphosphate synthase
MRVLLFKLKKVVMERRTTKQIDIGGVKVGGGAPITVQSMTKTDTRNVKATVEQIAELQDCGCEIIRLAVPDIEAARALAEIKKSVRIPLIADIHFDYRLALASLESGVDALRLNPGNIGGADRVRSVVNAAKERQTPIRIGVNFGSLPNDLDQKLTVPQKMVEAAMRHVRLLEELDFDLIKISLKAFDVPNTLAAYHEIARRVSYPLHVGITEAGTPRQGMIRSAVGIGILLNEGIGDTIRVSLTGHPRDEVYAGYEILKSLNLRQRGPVLVSCPTCGRTVGDVAAIAQQVENYLSGIDKPIKVAVMGCVVNGPGEAKDADIGVACGPGNAVLFSRGEKLRIIDQSDILSELKKEIEKF